jgi:hypothetical protein
LLLRSNFELNEPEKESAPLGDSTVEAIDLSGDEDDLNCVFDAMEPVTEEQEEPVIKKRKSKIIITGLDKPKKKKSGFK